MEKHEDNLDKLLKAELEKEAGEIMEEMDSDESLQDISFPEDLDEKMWSKIQEYEEQQKAYEKLSDADKEAIRLGREVQALRGGENTKDHLKKDVENDSYIDNVVPIEYVKHETDNKASDDGTNEEIEKKAGKKRERWQAIAKGAAEQSKRGIVPQVQDVMSFQEAMNYAKELDVVLVPYELQEGMKATEAVISKIEPDQSVGIFIGPEGGFDESEIEQAKEAGAIPITLGKRILRTETAGLTTLSILMYHLECREQLDDKNIR